MRSAHRAPGTAHAFVGELGDFLRAAGSGDALKLQPLVIDGLAAGRDARHWQGAGSFLMSENQIFVGHRLLLKNGSGLRHS